MLWCIEMTMIISIIARLCPECTKPKSNSKDSTTYAFLIVDALETIAKTKGKPQVFFHSNSWSTDLICTRAYVDQWEYAHPVLFLKKATFVEICDMIQKRAKRKLNWQEQT